MVDFIDSKNFDKEFSKLLTNKKGENVANGRVDIENISLINKPNFIVSLLQSYSKVFQITYKILFWEKDEVMSGFFNSDFKIHTSYKNGKVPGVIFIDDDKINEELVKSLLINHFNYEMAEEPSLNLRIQICLTQEKGIVLLDIYDDRGFDVYFINKTNK